MPSNEHLIRRIGQRIDEGYLQVVRDEDDVASLSALVLCFNEGKPLVIGCAGDGGLFSKKSQVTFCDLMHFAQSELNRLDFLSGATLDAVERHEGRLVLRTSRGTVTVRNLDDDLVVDLS